MGIEAAKNALAKSTISADKIDIVIACTMTPDYLCPSTAALIQDGIGAVNAGAFDLQAACSGFIYGISVAKAFIESQMATTVLVVATEKNSAFIDFSDRNTCVLFGDGASACLITNGGKGLQLNYTTLGAEGALSDLFIIPAGGSRKPSTPTSYSEKLHTMQMNGREVFKHAVRRMEGAINTCLETLNLQESDIDWLVPHQANIRIIDAIAKRFSIPEERVMKTVSRLGNTSASTIPLALDHIFQTHAPQIGDTFLMVAFGGGLTWGAAVAKYVAG
jgi:3-oxoacyl-[acyl-carrier-protein] synthase-3